VQVVAGERFCAPEGKAGLATAPVVAISEGNPLLEMFLKSLRDACRQIPIVLKNTLIEITRKKRERNMMTQFR
jgi:hypothetical protein